MSGLTQVELDLLALAKLELEAKRSSLKAGDLEEESKQGTPENNLGLDGLTGSEGIRKPKYKNSMSLQLLHKKSSLK